MTFHKYPVIERMPCLQGWVCVFNFMLQLLMQYSVKSKFDLRWTRC
jgi:hypothetical protein